MVVLCPCAKLVGDTQYSIVSDYLGTPTHGYDSTGNIVWERELDCYGATRKLKGEKDFCPYLYQGQYVDEETGLAYNRFRYYDCESGGYISQDPIGLDGGNQTLYSYVSDVNLSIDKLGLSQTYWLEQALNQAGRPLNPGQTAHHIVPQNSGTKFGQLSRDLLERNGLSTEISENGARLWGTGQNQVSQPGHPGRGTSGNRPANYHGGNHVHSAANDQMIYKILRSAERRGGAEGVKKALGEIGERMESGKWKANFANSHH
jgi:RHS repeat-associated protein